MRYEEVERVWNDLRCHEVLKVDMENELAVIRYKSGESFKILNDFGAFLWEKLEVNIDFKQLMITIKERYGILTENILEDIYIFLKILMKENLAYQESTVYQSIQREYEKVKYQVVGNGNNYNKVCQYYLTHRKPFKVFLELTYHCNLRCKHCYLGDETSTNNNMLSYEEIIGLLDQLEESGVKELVLTGGEVGTRNDFIDIVKYAVSKSFLVTILSNATLFRDDIYQELSKLNLFDCRISVYGPEEYHDTFVQKSGAYQHTIKFLEKINLEKGIGTAVYILTKENYKYIGEMEEIFDQKKIRYVMNPFLFPSIYGDITPTKYRISEPMLEEFFNNNGKIFGGSVCTAGVSKFRITPNGDVNPCEMLRHVKLGNIKETNFNDVLVSKERKEWCEEFEKVVKERKCNSCERKRFCGNCIGIAFLETKDYFGVSKYACDAAKLQCKCKQL